MRTRQTSPLFIGLILIGQSFHQGKCLGTALLPGRQLVLQLRRDLQSIVQVDLNKLRLPAMANWE